MFLSIQLTSSPHARPMGRPVRGQLRPAYAVLVALATSIRNEQRAVLNSRGRGESKRKPIELINAARRIAGSGPPTRAA